jgi:Ca2+-binding RTX toxin-like protein
MHEGREVPSVAVILPHPRVVLSGGILKVYGSSYADVITVTQHGNTISVLGKSFLASSVKGIEIRGGSGNDVITVSELITKPTCLFGDSGSDTIYGGGGSDVIYGGAGNDKLYGRGGDDVIYGGPDQDITDGGKGHNRVNQEGPSDDGVFLPQEREVSDFIKK